MNVFTALQLTTFFFPLSAFDLFIAVRGLGALIWLHKHCAWWISESTQRIQFCQFKRIESVRRESPVRMRRRLSCVFCSSTALPLFSAIKHPDRVSTREDMAVAACLRCECCGRCVRRRGATWPAAVAGAAGRELRGGGRSSSLRCSLITARCSPRARSVTITRYGGSSCTTTCGPSWTTRTPGRAPACAASSPTTSGAKGWPTTRATSRTVRSACSPSSESVCVLLARAVELLRQMCAFAHLHESENKAFL